MITTGTRWLLATERPGKKHRTGVVGISILVNACGRRTRHTYFVATIRGSRGQRKQHRFNIDTLGKQEAWRRALQVRAAYEVRVRAGVPTTPAREVPVRTGRPDKGTHRTRAAVASMKFQGGHP